jgi:ABC-2 type transport system permease protein
VSVGRIRAVVRKELRDFGRNRSIVITMGVLPLVFLIAPTITLINIPDSATGTVVTRAVGVTSLLLLIVPVVIPPIITGYSIIGERDQGTLEPVLTTPIRREELLLGKALAAFVPSVTVAYAIYAVFAVIVRLFASPTVSGVVWHAPQVLTQVLFIPLLAVWSIWVGIAMSARSSDVRVAQQLATLGSLPALAIVSLIQFQVITPSVPLAIGLALGLLVIDLAGWRFVAQLFDRERLITGASSTRTEGRPRDGDRVAAAPADADRPLR